MLVLCSPILACSGPNNERSTPIAFPSDELAFDLTLSGFRAPDATRSLQRNLGQAQTRTVSSPGVGSVIYTTGIDGRAGKVVGLAGFDPNTDVGAPLRGSLAVFSGRYGMALAHRIARDEGGFQGRRIQSAGAFQLQVDLQSGSLDGSGSDIFSEFGGLSVRGRVDDGAFRGTVEARFDTRTSGVRDIININGTLFGVLGTEGVLGAFHGAEERRVLSGGFAAGAPNVVPDFSRTPPPFPSP